MKSKISEFAQIKKGEDDLFEIASEVKSNTQDLQMSIKSHSNKDKGNATFVCILDRRSTIMPQSDDIFDILGDIAEPAKPQTKEDPEYGNLQNSDE
jgi:hypothetical protein